MILKNSRLSKWHAPLLMAALLCGAASTLRAGNDELLLAACANEDVSQAKSLLAAGANPDATGDKGLTCLMIAGFKGNDALARLMLQEGANRNLKFDGTTTAAELADLKNNGATAALIRDWSGGGRPRARASDADLLAACAAEDVPKVSSLLAAGANVNATASKGMTCLMVAALKGNDSLARTLLAAGADRELKFDGKSTAAQIADSKGNTATASLIRGASAAAPAADTAAANPDADFINAVAGQDVEKVKAMLRRGANPNAQTSGKSALLMAALFDNAPLVQALINGGADVNFKDESLTPLVVAAFKGNTAVAKSLILAGADCNFKTQKGQTAEQVADEKGMTATARAIRQACR